MRSYILLRLTKEQLEHIELYLSTPPENQTGLHKFDLENLKRIGKAKKLFEQKPKDERR